VPGNIVQFVQQGKAKVIATTGTKRFLPSLRPTCRRWSSRAIPDIVAASVDRFLARLPRQAIMTSTPGWCDSQVAECAGS
jgi:hypothetical protein